MSFALSWDCLLLEGITHVARHSFATSVALANGVSIENVAKMLGHSNTNMTRHYARVLDKSIKRDMALVNSKFSKQTIAGGQQSHGDIETAADSLTAATPMGF
ncbi:hypothetical protein FACS1894155_04620 [Bacteroidia bacterium]|nr:hypothetical protein FACS1894155_04620 [Bacteroidia bacterium]